jgi:hypothetical protein
MARPIKDTPAISGKDAEKFAKRLQKPMRASKEEIERARALYEAVKAQSKFAL